MTRVLEGVLLAALLLMIFALSACAIRPVPTCPQIADYSDAFQDAAADQLDQTVPEGSPIDIMIQDYGGLRDAARACWQEKNKHAF